jgi:transcriptional regulator with XRE-family HTH domain
LQADVARRVKARIGQRIVQLREDRGLTQEQLAERVGVSVRQLKRFEGGVSTINVVQIEGIALALGVPPPTLLEHPDRRIQRRPGRPKKR